MRASVGRIVHFYNSRDEREPMAAIVTTAYSGEAELVDLQIFGSIEVTPMPKVPKLGAPVNGRPATWGWSWPPRE